MDMHILTADFFESKIYLFEKMGHKFMVDCGGAAEHTVSQLQKLNFLPDYVLLTHGHIDHILSLSAVTDLGATVVIHPKDAVYLNDPSLNLSTQLLGSPFVYEGSRADAASVCSDFGIEMLHTPGHTPGSVCYLVENNLFSGDTLFCGGIGNTMFPGGSYEQEIQSVRSILKLPEHIKVYPGHGCPTTIMKEKNIVSSEF